MIKKIQKTKLFLLRSIYIAAILTIGIVLLLKPAPLYLYPDKGFLPYAPILIGLLVYFIVHVVSFFLILFDKRTFGTITFRTYSILLFIYVVFSLVFHFPNRDSYLYIGDFLRDSFGLNIYYLNYQAFEWLVIILFYPLATLLTYLFIDIVQLRKAYSKISLLFMVTWIFLTVIILFFAEKSFLFERSLMNASLVKNQNTQHQIQLKSVDYEHITEPLSIMDTIRKPDMRTWKQYSISDLYVLKYPDLWKVIIDNQNQHPGEEFSEWISQIRGSEGEISIYYTNAGYGGGCDENFKLKISYDNYTYALCGYKMSDGSSYVGQVSIRHPDKGIFVYASAIIYEPFEKNNSIVLPILFSLKLGNLLND